MPQILPSQAQWQVTTGASKELYANADGGAKTPTVNRDGFLLTNVDATNAILVSVGQAPTSTSFNYKILPGTWLYLDTPSLVYTLAAAGNPILQVCEYVKNRMGCEA